MKTYRTTRPGELIVLPILVTLLLFSCSGDKCTEVDNGDDPDRTADDLLLTFATSYVEKDLDVYEECLDEDFLFVFTDEVADSLHLPPEEPWWGKTGDLNSTSKMFGDPAVLSVAFSYEYLNDWYPCEIVRDDTTFSALCRRLEPLIEVTVSMPSPPYDPIVKYRADNSYLDVAVVPDRFEDGLLRILSIEEHHMVEFENQPILNATESSTWGGIKSMWADPTVEPEFDRSTPDNLLEMLASSYKEKDLAGYDECLCYGFLFYFTPEVADEIGLPPEKPCWGKTADLNSTEAMFDSPNVTDVTFTFEYVNDWYACTEVREDTTYSGLCCRLEPLIEVTTIVEGGDLTLKYRADESYLDIIVVPDPFVDDLWCILSIKEVKKQRLQGPVASLVSVTEPSSWGAIKSMWH